MSKWSEDITYKFVQEYIKHGCLYNNQDPRYKMKGARQRALLQLSEAMDIQGFGSREAYTKIRNLRSTYSQEVKKIKDSAKSGAGPADLYIPQIKWFRLLDNALNGINAQCGDSDSNMTAYTPSIQNVVAEDQTEETVPRERNTKSRASKRRANPAPVLQELREQLMSALNRVDTLIKEKLKKEDEEDEIELYTKLLAKKLRHFSQRECQEIMYDIDGLLLNRVSESDPIAHNVEFVSSPPPSPQAEVIPKQSPSPSSPYGSPVPSP